MAERSAEVIESKLCATSVFSVSLWWSGVREQQPQRHREHRGCTEKSKKFGPRVRVGQRQRGPSSTPSDEEGFTYGACTDAKGSERPDPFQRM
jgi:hypothetical protein